MSDDEEEEQGSRVVSNPLNPEPEPEPAVQQRRNLGKDRYGVAKLDMRSIQDTNICPSEIGECCTVPGICKRQDDVNTPIHERPMPAVIVLFPQFVFFSALFTWGCFLLPVGPASCDCVDQSDPDSDCALDEDLKKLGEWPTDHLLFYLTGWVQCTLMYLPVPMFGIFLSRIGSSDGTAKDESNPAKQGEDRASFLKSVSITASVSIFTIVLAMSEAAFWTGFPVPFTHLTAGFPGFFLVFVVVAIGLWRNEEDTPMIGLKMFQLFTMQFLIFFNIFMFSILSAFIKSDAWSDYQLLFALSFTVVKMITKNTLVFALKEDFDNCLPLVAFLNINAAVFPKVILPSAVSLTTYFTAAALDVFLTFVGLRMLWWPVLKIGWAQDEVDKEATEAIEARSRVQRLKDTAAKMQAEGAEQEAEFEETIKELEQAVKDQEKEEADVEEAEERKESVRKLVDLGGMASEANLVKSAKRLDGETHDEYEARTGIDLDGDGDVGGKRVDHKLTKEELKDVSDKQFKIVLLIVEEGAEVLIPLLVTLTEFFLYFGWNRNAVPTLASLPLDEFMGSTFLKLISCGIQIVTVIIAAEVVNSCTIINFTNVMVYEVNRHFWKLTVSCGSILVFCYATLMPHYNFNVALLVNVIENDKGDGNLLEHITDHFREGSPFGCGNMTDGSFGGDAGVAMRMSEETVDAG